MGFFTGKHGKVYNSEKYKEPKHPVTFADAYIDESDDLKDKHNFADERIAEQEKQDELDKIKQQQKDADEENKRQNSRQIFLNEIDDIIVSAHNVDYKINTLEQYLNDDRNVLTAGDKAELKKEINELKEMEKSMNKSESKSDSKEPEDESKSDKDTKSDSKEPEDENKSNEDTKSDSKSNDKEPQKPRIFTGPQKQQKDYSDENNLHPDESVRVSYLLATASDG